MEDLKVYLTGMESHLMGMESRLMAHFESWLSAEVGSLESRFTNEMGSLESRIMSRVEGRIDASEDRLKAAIRDAAEGVENKILGEFWKWGRTSDMRTRQALGNVFEFNDRLMAIEDRVSSLERRP